MIKEEHSVLVDENTGEIYREELKQNYSKLWKDGKGGMILPRNYHFKHYKNIKLRNVIRNKGDLLKTYILLEETYKNTNIIYFVTESGKTRPATIQDIADILEIKYESAQKYLNRMKDIGVIAELTIEIQKRKYKSYIFNPIYGNSYKYISNEIYLLFKPYIDQYIPDWMKRKYLEWNEDGKLLDK